MNNFFKSIGYAFKGIRTAFASERNLKVQIMMAVLTILAGFYFGITSTEWCIILLTIALVLGMEIMNTSIENLVDLITLERKPLAGKIKDIAAGAVLVVSGVAVIIGIIIFRQYII